MTDHHAKLVIHGAGRMTKRGRKYLAAWLRKHAASLEKEGDRYASRFTGRYMKVGA